MKFYLAIMLEILYKIYIIGNIGAIFRAKTLKLAGECLLLNIFNIEYFFNIEVIKYITKVNIWIILCTSYCTMPSEV